ncbi:Uma2 family endonuclease [Nodosilinea sp. E11]|uniref:Uma2 family endonuclease n=1 Tax=Nodosilinea sp. E11 TaxID=3037479 RepID=UPI00293461CB|nr:Uma2 family endonuclease [Nodosilinea sp. E11]WOD40576.1 Uma2 family endonuclease [Nodosilinea sp. E11]
MFSGQIKTQTSTQSLVYDAPAMPRQRLSRKLPRKPLPQRDRNISLTPSLAERLRQEVDSDLVRTHDLSMQVKTLPNISQAERAPDLMVLTPELAESLKGSARLITLEMPNPLLVVEVVSPYSNPCDDNYRRDYIEKRQQYEQRSVPEYWIVDPTAAQITVLVQVPHDGYRGRLFRGQQRIESSGFPTLSLTVDGLFALGAK